jgi:uncharacterized membrane protein YgcG
VRKSRKHVEYVREVFRQLREGRGVVCPRCLEPAVSLSFSWSRGRLRLLAYHGRRDGKARVCYLGTLYWDKSYERDWLLAAEDCVSMWLEQIEEGLEYLSEEDQAALLEVCALRLGDYIDWLMEASERLTVLALRLRRRARALRAGGAVKAPSAEGSAGGGSGVGGGVEEGSAVRGGGSAGGGAGQGVAQASGAAAQV